MRKYETLEIEVICFNGKDVICASDPFSGDWDNPDEEPAFYE